MKKIVLILSLIMVVIVSGCTQGNVGECTLNSIESCDKSCEVDNDCKNSCPCGPISANEECDTGSAIHNCLQLPGDVKCIENTCTFIIDETAQYGVFTECLEKSGEFCIALYDPVCGDDGKTYSNDCEACRVVGKYKSGEC